MAIICNFKSISTHVQAIMYFFVHIVHCSLREAQALFITLCFIGFEKLCVQGKTLLILQCNVGVNFFYIFLSKSGNVVWN